MLPRFQPNPGLLWIQIKKEKNVYFFLDFHLWHVGLFGSKMGENVKEAADRWDTLIQHYLSPHYGTGHERLSLCSQDLQYCERFERSFFKNFHFAIGIDF